MQLKRKNYQQQIHVHVNVHYTQIVIKQKQARFYETRKTVENFSYKNILPTSVSQKLCSSVMVHKFTTDVCRLLQHLTDTRDHDYLTDKHKITQHRCTLHDIVYTVIYTHYRIVPALHLCSLYANDLQHAVSNS